jgi:hypothetical protein
MSTRRAAQGWPDIVDGLLLAAAPLGLQGNIGSATSLEKSPLKQQSCTSRRCSLLGDRPGPVDLQHPCNLAEQPLHQPEVPG